MINPTTEEILSWSPDEIRRKQYEILSEITRDDTDPRPADVRQAFEQINSEKPSTDLRPGEFTVLFVNPSDNQLCRVTVPMNGRPETLMLHSIASALVASRQQLVDLQQTIYDRSREAWTASAVESLADTGDTLLRHAKELEAVEARRLKVTRITDKLREGDELSRKALKLDGQESTAPEVVSVRIRELLSNAIWNRIAEAGAYVTHFTHITLPHTGRKVTCYTFGDGRQTIDVESLDKTLFQDTEGV